MRVVFAGTPQVALPALEAVVNSSHEVLAVLTRPDAPAGRGRRTRPSPVREFAQAANIAVLAPDRPSDPQFLTQLADLAPDVVPVVAYGALVPAAALAIPTHGWVNLHFSLLPAWRGAAPVQRALIAGDELAGASTFVLEQGLDTGPVIDSLQMPIGPREVAGDLLARLAVAGAELLVASLDAIEQGSAHPVPQPTSGVSYAPKLTVADAQVNWTQSSAAIDRHVRGCTPAPGAWTTLRGQRLNVLETALVPASAELAAEAAPGAVHVTKRSVLIRTGDGWLECVRVQGHGKRAMAATDWARGARLDSTERLGA